MAIPLSNINDDATLLKAHIEANTTWEEFHAHLAELETYIKSAHPTHIALITTSDMDLPKGNPIPHLQHLFKMLNAQPNFDVHIVVGMQARPLARTFTRIVSRLTVHNYRFLVVETLEEAVGIIHRTRQQLDSTG